MSTIMAATDDEPEALDEELTPLEEVAPGILLPKRKRGGGRPPKYRPEFARAAKIMLKRGATISELAEAFGVKNGTIHAWRNQHEEFSKQFSELSEDTTPRVIRSLAELATGYTVDVPKVFMYKGVPMTVWVREEVAPSFQAIKHYLSIKAPEWRVKDEVEFSGDEAFAALWQQMNNKKKDEGG